VKRPHKHPKVKHQLTVNEVAAKVRKLGLVRRNEAARLVREDRDRQGPTLDIHPPVYDIFAAANISLARRRKICISARSSGRLAHGA
jgi:hypothetical protein